MSLRRRGVKIEILRILARQVTTLAAMADAVMADVISQQAVSMTYFDLLGHTFVVSYEKSQVSILKGLTDVVRTRGRTSSASTNLGLQAAGALNSKINENGKPRARKLCIIEGSKPLKLLKPYSKLMELQLLMGLQPAAALSYWQSLNLLASFATQLSIASP
ncbi:hypothetical protein Tco_1133704 [Tanacetum coccineum]